MRRVNSRAPDEHCARASSAGARHGHAKPALLAFALGVNATATAEEPAPKDYPGIGHILNYELKDHQDHHFDALKFQIKDETIEVDGHKISYSFACYSDATHVCESILGVNKEFEAVLHRLGGEILVEDPPEAAPNGHLVGRFGRNGQAVYLDVRPWNDGEGYDLDIVEEQEFQPSMVGGEPDAKPDFKGLIDSTGKAVLHINFDFDKAALRPDAASLIQEITAAMRAEPDLKLQVNGHTDGLGSDAHNQTLSEQRAAAVTAALEAVGIDSSRLVAAGFGATQPVASNATADGRAENRRVEFIKK